MLEWLELFAYRKADRIVPVTDAFRRDMMDKGVDERKITVIKNGVDLRFFQSAADGSELASQLGVEGKFVASYVGTHGMAHHLETILEAAAFIDHQDIVFLLVGDGAERNRLLALRDRMGLKNVIMLDQLPKASMPALWSISDASLVLLKKMDLFRTVIPSKIFESMAMEVPIILGVAGESQAMIEEAEAGICITPERADELAAAVMRLYEDRELGKRLGAKGRRYVEDHFNRDLLAERYAELLAVCVRPRSSAVG